MAPCLIILGKESHMKPIIAFVLSAFMLVSCVDYTHETRYDYRDRMIGTYSVDEYSDTYHEYLYYTMRVSKEYGTRDGLLLKGFYAEGLTVSAYVSGDYIDIPYQITNGYEVEGHGTFYRGEFRLNYTVRDRYSDAPTDYCDAVAYPGY